MAAWSTWSGVQGIEFYGGTQAEFNDLTNQLAGRAGNTITPDQWRLGTWKALQCLYTPPCTTSATVLQMINEANLRWKKKLILVPAGIVDQKYPGSPDSGNARFVEQDRSLIFTPQDHDNPDRSPGSLDLADEVLLHELVHAMRAFFGLSNTERWPYPGQYDNIGEFCAIVITNIYRSENRRPRLRGDHQGMTELLHPFNDPARFASTWSFPLRQLRRELGWAFSKIAAVQCPFNPLAASRQQ